MSDARCARRPGGPDRECGLLGCHPVTSDRRCGFSSAGGFQLSTTPCNPALSMPLPPFGRRQGLQLSPGAERGGKGPASEALRVGGFSTRESGFLCGTCRGWARLRVFECRRVSVVHLTGWFRVEHAPGRDLPHFVGDNIWWSPGAERGGKGPASEALRVGASQRGRRVSWVPPVADGRRCESLSAGGFRLFTAQGGSALSLPPTSHLPSVAGRDLPPRGQLLAHSVSRTAHGGPSEARAH